MEVLLKRDVEGIGLAGEVKRVSDGHAVNFLIPRGFAVIATEGARKQSEQVRRIGVKHRAKERSEADAVAEQITGTHLQFTAKSGEKNGLYGSITSGDIAEAIEQATGLTVDKRRIELESSIKELGTHEVSLRLAPEVRASITVEIVSEDGEEGPTDQEPSKEAEETVKAEAEEGSEAEA